MGSLIELLTPLWGYIAAAAAVVGGLVYARLSGRKAQREETAAKVAQQQGAAYKAVKEVHDAIDQAGPDGSRERSKQWVRNGKDAGRD